MESQNGRRIYDGADYCPGCTACPVAEYHEGSKSVVLRDPTKPQNGRFTMTVDEYNTLLRNAQLLN
ncbi:MAG: hypothetical protein Q7R79_01155 [bacterium]|nr:hypothetical protein [bacterium]